MTTWRQSRSLLLPLESNRCASRTPAQPVWVPRVQPPLSLHATLSLPPHLERALHTRRHVPSARGGGRRATRGVLQVFQPGVHEVPAGEELDYDRTAYDCLHKWALDWPCLSFDVCKDALGERRTAFPHTAYMVAGTQAAAGERNHVSVMKLSALTQGQHGKARPPSGAAHLTFMRPSALVRRATPCIIVRVRVRDWALARAEGSRQRVGRQHERQRL
jgi:Histone-binding protein RBBP4 or subunit C of CAF1 complex